MSKSSIHTGKKYHGNRATIVGKKVDMCHMKVDFGNTAQDYKTYRQGFPPAFFEKLQSLSLIGEGKHVLDIGTGTGTVARGCALSGSHVTAIDIAQPLLEQAKVLDEAQGADVTYHIARAEDTSLASASFDTVTAGQCWHWFDRPRATAEVYRLLVPRGHIVIAHLDWIPLAGNVVDATEKLILKHNPTWSMDGGTGLYPAWLTDVGTGGFVDIETFSFDINLIYTHEAWRGRIRASAGISASLSDEAVQQFDDAMNVMLAQDFPDNPLQVHHRVWTVIARKPNE